MDTKLIIHCVGLEGLTITVGGADHSIQMNTDMLRITSLLGVHEYSLPQLPVSYDVSDLNGNLVIADGSGKTLYRWRLHSIAQTSAEKLREHRSQPTHTCREDNSSPSISDPPSYSTARKEPNSRPSQVQSELNHLQRASSNGENIKEDEDSMSRFLFLI